MLAYRQQALDCGREENLSLNRRWDGFGFQEQKRLLYLFVERVGYDRQSVSMDFREGAFEALVKETRNLEKRMGGKT